MIVLLQRLLTTAAAVALLAVVAIVLLTGTAAGTRWLLATAQDLAGDSLALEDASGSLLDGLSVGRLHVRTGTVEVELSNAVVRLHWPDLLRGQVTLESPAAEELVITLTPDPDAPPGDGGAVELPVAIVAEGLRLGRLLIHAGAGEPVILDDLRFAGRFDRGVVDFTALEAGLYGARVSMAGRFDTASPYALTATTQWRFTDLDIHGEGELSGSLAELTIDQRIRPAAEATDDVVLTGALRLLDSPVGFEVTAQWQRLQREFAGVGLLVSDGGRLAISGDLEAYRAELVTDLRLPVGVRPAAQLQATARGDTARLVFDRLQLQALDGSIDASGALAFADGVSGDFQVAVRQLDPGHLDPRLEGTVDLDGAIHFDADGSFAATIDEARGNLAGRPLTASGEVSRRNGVLAVDDFSLAAGSNQLHLDATLEPRLDGRFRLTAPELHVLWPGLNGNLVGQGTLAGTLQRPSGSVRFEGETIAAAGARIDRLQLDASLTESGGLDVDLRTAGMVAGERLIGDLAFIAEGRLDDHATRLQLSGGPVAATLEGSAGWEQGNLRGTFHHTLQSGTVTTPGDYVWRLREPATLAVAAGGDTRLGAHCWTVDDARLCFADSRLSAETVEAGVTLGDFPLASIAAFLGDGFGMSGTADAELVIDRSATSLAGFLVAQTSGAVLTWRTPEGDEISDGIETLHLRVDATTGEISYDARFADSFGTTLTAEGRVLDPLAAEPTISGSIEGGIPDLGRLSPVLEGFVDIGDLAGAVRLQARLSGRLRSPDFSGGLELAGGGLSVPAAGISVGDIRLDIDGREDGSATLRGRASSGGGDITLEGDLVWRETLVPEGRFTVTGENFELINLPEGIVRVSPDIRVALLDGVFRVSGRLLVPRASITLREIADSAVEVSPDVVVHGRETGSAVRRPALFVLDGVEVVLGQDVSFEGFGLTANLAGSLILDQGIGADPNAITGEGVVRVTEGQFEALGQTLAIERGALIFAGSINEPSIDVRAVREISYEGRDVKVGLLLTGSIARIRSQTFSEPAMSEMDVLAYLTTGRPLAAAGAGDRLSVTNAALTLGLRGAQPITQKLGSALSIDELGFAGGGDLDDTSLVVGEQFGQDLFVRYSFGVFNRIGLIKVTYRLNRRVSIEATSGEEQALDLLYSVTW